ncbi:MAG: class I SAM-dependent methyltransferase [Bacilli bacterium]|nr:class I SAM-dependent methyltransferase [Bacilli bacterium]MBN2696978.1 class I SAM-dependent methyltransferase [Bacilli bacterium]
MIKVAEWSHELFLQRDFHDKILIDMTCGSGRDTLFLAGIANKVYAFDIQVEAIEMTRSLLEQNNVTNVTLINSDHQFVSDHVKKPIAGAIYNLGYLPGGSKEIRTESDSTINSLKKLLELLEIEGIVVLVVYQKHTGNESMRLLHFVERLPSRHFDVMKYSVLNKELAPYIIKITKTA